MLAADGTESAELVLPPSVEEPSRNRVDPEPQTPKAVVNQRVDKVWSGAKPKPEPGVLLIGRVRGPSGRPLGGLPVLLGIFCGGSRVKQLELQTDPTGVFTGSIPAPDAGLSRGGGLGCSQPGALLSIDARDHVAWESWHELRVCDDVVDLGDVVLSWGGRIEGSLHAGFTLSDSRSWTVSVLPLRPELPILVPRGTTSHVSPGADGDFALELVPPGPAKVIVAHDLLGLLHEERVQVADGATTRFDFPYRGKDPSTILVVEVRGELERASRLSLIDARGNEFPRSASERGGYWYEDLPGGAYEFLGTIEGAEVVLKSGLSPGRRFQVAIPGTKRATAVPPQRKPDGSAWNAAEDGIAPKRR